MPVATQNALPPSASNIAELRDLRSAGMSWRAISDATGIPPSTIRHRIRFFNPMRVVRQARFEEEVLRQRRAGLAYTEIADELCIAPSTAREIVLRRV